MKFRLEADPAELPGKVGLLLDELAHRLAVFPDTANVLHKAANDLSGQEQLRYPVALEIARKWHDGYARHIVLMQQAIGKVLDEAADDSAMGKSLDPYDPFGCNSPPDEGGDWVELPEDVALILMVDLAKARPVPKYIRRIFNPTPPPKYRYFYNVTGGAGLGHQSELSEGSAFAFEHNGQAGHYHVKKVEGEQVTAEHSGSGHQLQLHRNDFTRMLRDHHIGKIRDAIGKVAAQRQKMTEAAGKREQKLREMFPEHAGEATQQAAPGAAKPAAPTPEAAPVPAAAAVGQAEAPPAPKPAPAAVPPPEKAPGATAPKLPRAGMHELGGGGYDSIEAVGLDAEELEQQAAAMSKDREYAVIPQTKGFVLVSRSKAPAGKEAVGSKTNVLLKNESGSGLQELPAEWVVMEAGDIVASHNPMTFDKRADYPEGVQERRYHEIKDEQLKIDRIARNKATPTLVANTNPDAVNGAPIVTEHGVVLGGNGRAMGMQRAYEMYPEQAQKLKEYLASQASQFGLRGSQVMGMQRPILVRRVQAGQETDKLTRLGRRMNESLTQGLDPRAEEVAVSKFVTKDLVQSLTTHMEPDQTLADFLQKGQSLPFIKDLEHAGIIDATNRAQYVNQDTGLLNEHGRSRVSRVLAARMIPDPTLLDNMDQSLRNNLALAVPFMLAAEEKGWDLREPLLMAVKADHEMSAKGYPRDVNGRDSYIRQPALFGDKESVRKKVEKDPAASALLEILQDHNGPKKLQAGFKSFAMEADAQAHDYGAQGSMFARPKVSQDQALAQAFKLKSGPTPEKKLAASWRGTFDLVKALSPQQARTRAMHALNWEAERLVSGAHLVSHRHETEIDWQALANKLEAFVDEHKRREPELREALRDLDRDQLLELLQAHGQLRGHAAPQSLRKAQAGPFIGPRGGMWADPEHTQHWEQPQPELFSPGEHQTKVEILHSSKIIAQDPALTPEQKAKPISPALQEIQKRVSTDLREWKLPAGARVSDPWEPPKVDPSATWSHPDYGSGTGAAPWQQGEDWTPDLHKYDCILINSSAGKDSQAMLTHVVEQADKIGYPRSKIVVVHCDLGRVEWEGTKDLARAQAEHYGLRFEVVKRQQNDLVEHIEAHGGDLNQRKADTVLLFEAGVRTWQDLANASAEQVTKIIGADKGQSQSPGQKRAEKLISAAKSKAVKKIATDPIDFGGAIAWPDMKSRYCTSDHKRGPVMTLMTQLAAEHREKAGPSAPPMRILNALGIRAQESSGRAKMANFEREDETGRRVVDRWYPIHRWNERRVWETIERSGVPHHRAYNLGMRRLSCVFCVFATKEDLMIAAKHNADLFNTYLELEEKVGAKFTAKMSLADVRSEIERRRNEGYELNDLAQWVKKALDLDDGALDLVKAEVSRVSPDLVLLVMEAALARLRKDGQPIDTVAMEWKATGACVHLDTDVDSFHALYLPYPEAYNDSLIIAAFAKDHGFTFEEHNPPPPLDGETLEKAEAGPFIGPRGGKWADAAHTIPWHEGATSGLTGAPEPHLTPSHGEGTSSPTGVPEAHPVGRVASEYPVPDWAQRQGFNEPWRSTWYSFGEKAPEHVAKQSIDLTPEFNWKVNEVGAYKAREMLREQFKDVKPEPGHQLVYRIGSSEGALHGRNAGSLEGVLDHLMSGEESPGGKKLTAYSVKLPEQFGEYEAKRGAYMQKAKQLFIGPKGGKWADAKHTQHWEPDKPSMGGGPKPPIASTILAFLHAGGKVRPHDTEPGKAVLKIAMEKKHHLETLKQESGLSGQIEHGPNKARLVVTADDAKKLMQLGGYTPKPPTVKQPAPVTEAPSAEIPEKQLAPVTKPPAGPAKVSEFKVTSAKDWTHDKALDAVTADTGLTREQVREALQGPASPKENARMKRRVQIETSLLKTGLAHENALSKLLAEHQDSKAVAEHLNKIVSASEKGMAAAVEQYKAVPLYDLQVLSGVKVADKPIEGYAVCYMNERRLTIGIRPDTGTWATGDFRHELGHAIHGGCLGSALDDVIKAHYKAVKSAVAEHGKAPMKGPQSSDWYEEKIGVTGKRGLDDAKEDWAEHYRCYHRAWYQENVLHAKKKGSASLAEYRNRHPEMAAVMDARYTAALLGQLAAKGAW